MSSFHLTTIANALFERSKLIVHLTESVILCDLYFRSKQEAEVKIIPSLVLRSWKVGSGTFCSNLIACTSLRMLHYVELSIEALPMRILVLVSVQTKNSLFNCVFLSSFHKISEFSSQFELKALLSRGFCPASKIWSVLVL